MSIFSYIGAMRGLFVVICFFLLQGFTISKTGSFSLDETHLVKLSTQKFFTPAKNLPGTSRKKFSPINQHKIGNKTHFHIQQISDELELNAAYKRNWFIYTEQKIRTIFKFNFRFQYIFNHLYPKHVFW